MDRCISIVEYEHDHEYEYEHQYEYDHEQEGVKCFLCYREGDPKMGQS